MARIVAYDLLILDVMLPGLDGWTILTALRRDGQQMPVGRSSFHNWFFLVFSIADVLAKAAAPGAAHEDQCPA
jgi:CheY-like chemotaxis protein